MGRGCLGVPAKLAIHTAWWDSGSYEEIIRIKTSISNLNAIMKFMGRMRADLEFPGELASRTAGWNLISSPNKALVAQVFLILFQRMRIASQDCRSSDRLAGRPRNFMVALIA